MDLSRHVMARGAALALATVMCGNAAAQEQQVPPMIAGGLQRMQGSKVELAYVRPGINWMKYRTIMLKALIVPANARPGTGAGFGESYTLPNSVVALLQNAFVMSMKNVLGSAGYTFVTAPQADTLIVVPRVVSINLSVPVESSHADYSRPGFTLSERGGSITVAAVLADGSSRAVIAEAIDRKYGSNVWGMNNSPADFAEAGEIFDQWADDLRNTLQLGPTSQHELIMPITGNPELDSSGATAR